VVAGLVAGSRGTISQSLFLALPMVFVFQNLLRVIDKSLLIGKIY